MNNSTPIFLTTALLFSSLTAQAQEEPAPALNWKLDWVNIYDCPASAGEKVQRIDVAPDGNYIMLGAFGGNNVGNTFSVNGKVQKDVNGDDILGQSNYTSTTNYNVLISKINAETGVPMWTFYSNDGDCASINDLMVASDGSIYFTMEIRPTSIATVVDEKCTLVQFVDAKGVEHTVNTSVPSDEWENSRFFQGMLVKLDANGGYLDCVRFELNRGYYYNDGTNLNLVTQGTYPSSICEDEEGAIYIGGHMCGPMAIVTPSGKDQYLIDGEESVLYIAKFSSNLSLISTKFSKGADYTSAQICNLSFDNGTIYCDGNVKGIGDVTIGGVTVTPNAEKKLTPIYAAFDKSLTPLFVKTYSPTSAKFDMKHFSLQIIDDKAYINGSINGDLDCGEFVLNGGANKLLGTTLVLDKTNGNALGALCVPSAISGTSGVIISGENINVLGYNSAYAYSVESFNANYEYQSSTVLFRYGTIMLADCTPIVNGKQIVFGSRCGKNNANVNANSIEIFNKGDLDLDFNVDGWATFCMAYTIDTPSTIISNKRIADGVEDFSVYTLSGICLRKTSTRKEALRGLPRGIYIVNNACVSVK